ERRLGLHLQLKEAVRRQVKPVPKFNFGQGSYSFFKASRLVKKIFRLNQQMVLSIPFFLDQVKFLRSLPEGFINGIQSQLVILDPEGSVLRQKIQKRLPHFPKHFGLYIRDNADLLHRGNGKLIFRIKSSNAFYFPAEKLNPEGKDRKSTRLNSSHVKISYAVFCLKKKKKTNR